MIAHSNDFKNAITKLGRDIKIHIDYFLQVYNLQTEDNKLIITQDNAKLLTEEMHTSEPSNYMTEDDVISLNKNNLGELFRTYMKSFDIETTVRFNVGDKMIIKIGTTVNGEPEYLNYGIYYVYEKKYNEDTKTYTYTVCDKMLFTMIPFNADEIFGSYEEATLENLIHWILDYCGIGDGYITYQGQRYNYNEFDNIPNGDKTIYKKTFGSLNITCRDVLDMIMQCTGTSMIVNYLELGTYRLEQFTYKSIGNTSVDTINEDILNTSKVEMTEKFGVLNSLLFSKADGVDNIEAKDSESIEENGMTRYVIKDNLILEQDNREDYLNPLFNQIKGLEYYVCDIDTIGLYYIEYLDRFDVSANNNLYHCLCLKNTGEIQNGMSESFKTESPEEKELTFESIGTDDKKASITMDKLKGEIVLKTDSDGKLAQVRLDSSGDEGSSVQISADSIDFSSHTFNLDTDDITIESDKINISKDGIFIDGSGYASRFELEDTSNHCLFQLFARQLYMKSTVDNSYFSITPYTAYSSGQSWEGYSIELKNSLGAVASMTDEDLYIKNIRVTNVYYENLIPLSLEEKKKDFEKLENALDIIKSTDIYKFRYKDEEDTKKHIGLVIGDDYNYSQEITSNGNNGVDLYSFISVCCKAIQEQQEQIEELRKEIDNLKGGNK